MAQLAFLRGDDGQVKNDIPTLNMSTNILQNFRNDLFWC